LGLLLVQKSSLHFLVLKIELDSNYSTLELPIPTIVKGKKPRLLETS